MEENIAILMADLSGYTALTEIHGSVSAANLIDKFVAIIEDSLVGDCKLKERIGDEVMIVSASPDELLSTAVMIMKSVSREENFLQVHGGLHYGTVLKRNGSYFGTAVNLTSRIAAKADAGSFWCSLDFIDALADKPAVILRSKGKYKFKNISEEKEITEIVGDTSNSFFVDPVCNMLILNKEVATKHPASDQMFFCSHVCRDIHISMN